MILLRLWQWKCKKKTNKYWKVRNVILSIAYVLDPRSKLACNEHVDEIALGEVVSKKKSKENTTLLKKIYSE